MKYKILGKSGLRVSELCLGIMTFGTQVPWGTDKNESYKIFKTFLDAGGNFIDTADIYQAGMSEEFLGEFMQTKREELVVATKYTISSNQQDPNAGGSHRKNLVQSLEASLKRLKTNYVDLLWVHRYDPLTPIEETMRALDDVVRQGKVLHIGISNAPAWIVAKANTLADLKSWTPFSAMQIEYNLTERSAERELLDVASHFEMAVTPWSPLASGILTGKYNFRTSEHKRLESDPFRKINDRHKTIASKVMEIAEKLGATPAKVALRWLMQRDKNIIPIIGARTLSQLEDNLGVLDIHIPEMEMIELDNISKIDPCNS